MTIAFVQNGSLTQVHVPVHTHTHNKWVDICMTGSNICQSLRLSGKEGCMHAAFRKN